MNVSQQLILKFINRRSIERAVAPIASQVALVILIAETQNTEDNETTHGSSDGEQAHDTPVPNVFMAAKILHESVKCFIQEEEEGFINPTEQEKQEMASANERLTVMSSHLLILARRFESGSAPDDVREQLCETAKEVLEGVLRILYVIDAREIRSIVNVVDSAYLEMEKVDQAETADEAAEWVQPLGAEILKLNYFVGRRTMDMHSKACCTELDSCLSTLKKSVYSLTQAKATCLMYPNNFSAKESLESVMNEIRENFQKIKQLIQEGLPKDIDEYVVSFVGLVDKVMQSLSTHNRLNKKDNLEAEIVSVVQHSMTVAHFSHGTYRDMIVASCIRILHAKSGIFKLDGLVREKPDHIQIRSQFTVVCETFLDEICELERHVNMALLKLIIETFICPSEYQAKLRKSAEMKDPLTQYSDLHNQHIRRFSEFTETLCQVSLLVAASSTDKSKIKEIMDSVQCLESIEPEVSPAVLALSRDPGRYKSQRHLDLVLGRWQKEVDTIISAIDTMVDPRVFMDMTGTFLVQKLDQVKGLFYGPASRLQRQFYHFIFLAERPGDLARKLQEESSDPIYRNGLEFFIRVLFEYIYEANAVFHELTSTSRSKTSSDGTGKRETRTAKLPTSQQCDTLERRMKLVVKALKMLRGGLDIKKHPHLLSEERILFKRRGDRDTREKMEKEREVLTENTIAKAPKQQRSIPRKEKLEKRRVTVPEDIMAQATTEQKSIPREEKKGASITESMLGRDTKEERSIPREGKKRMSVTEDFIVRSVKEQKSVPIKEKKRMSVTESVIVPVLKERKSAPNEADLWKSLVTPHSTELELSPKPDRLESIHPAQVTTDRSPQFQPKPKEHNFEPLINFPKEFVEKEYEGGSAGEIYSLLRKLISASVAQDHKFVEDLTHAVLCWTNHIIEHAEMLMEHSSQMPKAGELKNLIREVDAVAPEVIHNARFVAAGDTQLVHKLLSEGEKWAALLNGARIIIDVAIDRWLVLTCDLRKTIDLNHEQRLGVMVNAIINAQKEVCQLLLKTRFVSGKYLASGAEKLEFLTESHHEIENSAVTIKNVIDMISSSSSRTPNDWTQLEMTCRDWSVFMTCVVSEIDQMSDAMEVLGQQRFQDLPKSDKRKVLRLADKLERETNSILELVDCTVMGDSSLKTRSEELVAELHSALADIIAVVNQPVILSETPLHALFSRLRIGLAKTRWIEKALDLQCLIRDNVYEYMGFTRHYLLDAMDVTANTDLSPERKAEERKKLSSQFLEKSHSLKQKVLRAVQMCPDLTRRAVVRSTLDDLAKLTTHIEEVIRASPQITEADVNSLSDKWGARMRKLIFNLRKMDGVKSSTVDGIENYNKGNSSSQEPLPYDVPVLDLGQQQGQPSEQRTHTTLAMNSSHSPLQSAQKSLENTEKSSAYADTGLTSPKGKSVQVVVEDAKLLGYRLNRWQARESHQGQGQRSKIIRLALEMAKLCSDMAVFTKGEGPFKTSNEVIGAAVEIVKDSNELENFAKRLVAMSGKNKCTESLTPCINKMNACASQLHIISTALHNSAKSYQGDRILVRNASNLLTAVRQMFSLVESIAAKGVERPDSSDDMTREVLSLLTTLRADNTRYLQDERQRGRVDDLGLRRVEMHKPPSVSSMVDLRNQQRLMTHSGETSAKTSDFLSAETERKHQHDAETN